MTGVQIKQAAEMYIEEFIDDPDALAAINRALNLLGDLAEIYDRARATIEDASQWYELPPTTTHVREVLDGQGRVYTGWSKRDNLIRFFEPGTYEIMYRRLPQPLTGINATPEVHPAFHQLLITYVIGWWKLKDDDTNPDGLRHMQMFREDAVRIFNTLRRSSGGPKTMGLVR